MDFQPWNWGQGNRVTIIKIVIQQDLHESSIIYIYIDIDISVNHQLEIPYEIPCEIPLNPINPIEPHEIPWNPMKYHEIPWNPYEIPRLSRVPHGTTERSLRVRTIPPLPPAAERSSNSSRSSLPPPASGTGPSTDEFYRYIMVYIYIWVTYNISLTWIKAILGMIPLTNHDSSEVAVRSL